MTTKGSFLEEIVIRVSIEEYLDELKTAENRKPLNQRKAVPSLADLVRLTGVNRASLYNLAGNKYESVRLDMLGAVINALRKEGFEVAVANLLTEHPISTLPDE